MKINCRHVLLAVVLIGRHSWVNRASMPRWICGSPTRTGRRCSRNKQLVLAFGRVENQDPTIEIDPTKTYQTIDGFGYTLTGGSAMHIVRMDATSRNALLKELFATEGTCIGVSYLRVSIGASDLNERVFSYNDLPPGQIDPEHGEVQPGPGSRGRDPGVKGDSEDRPGHQDHGIAVVAAHLDEEQQQIHRRKPETRVLRGLRQVLREVHSGNEGGRDPD